MVCCVDKCPARVYYYDNGDCFYADQFCGHNHTTTFEQTVKVHEFKQSLKEECAKLDTFGGKLPSVRDIYDKISDQ